MEIQEQADKIASETIAAKRKLGLRLPPEGEVKRAEAECIDRLTELYQQGSTKQEVAHHAAVATYRANEAERHNKNLRAYLGRFLDALDEAELASKDEIPMLVQRMTALRGKGRTLISAVIDLGIAIGAKQAAANASRMSNEKIDQVKDFAIEKFNAGSWKSPRYARKILFKEVQAYALRLGWKMTDTTGPETLYRWFLAHVKSMSSAG